MNELAIFWPALVAGLLVTATHVPLGIQVLNRGIVFIDRAHLVRGDDDGAAKNDGKRRAAQPLSPQALSSDDDHASTSRLLNSDPAG